MKATLYMTLEQIVGSRPEQAADELRKVSQAAEKAGFDACNLTDHPAPTVEWLQHGHDAFDPMAALCFVAGVTERILLHTNIVVLPYRNPLITAKEAATLDVLSGGRLIFGVGLGYLEGEYDAVGADFASRGKAMDEAIDVIKLAWSGEPFAYNGRTFNAAGNHQRPAPLQKPNPPIWGGGNSLPAMRRAAQRCDGWQPFFMPEEVAARGDTDAIVTVDDLRRKIEVLNGLREDAGHKGPFDIAPTSPVPVSACTAEVADRFIQNAQAMAQAGVTWVCSGVPGKDASEMAESVAWFGETILPHIR